MTYKTSSADLREIIRERLARCSSRADVLHVGDAWGRRIDDKRRPIRSEIAQEIGGMIEMRYNDITPLPPEAHLFRYFPERDGDAP